MLTEDQLNRAESFILKYARPLDQAWYNYEFHNLEKVEVIAELISYQNEDGGFGNSLEPDIRLPKSSVMATTIALQYISHLKIEKHQIIENSVSYLQKNANIIENMVYFPKVPLSVMDHDHAPWWSISKIQPPEFSSWPNPNAEIIGYFNHWSNLVDPELIDLGNKTANQYLNTFLDSDEFNVYHYLCWKRALPYLSSELQQKVKLMTLSQLDNMDLSLKTLGHVKPQWLVTETSSFLYRKFSDEFDQMFLMEIEKQADDGGWYPEWIWGSDDIWKSVEKEWAGKITIELLLTLKHCELI